MALLIKKSVAVTPHDTTNLGVMAQGVVVSGAGNVVLVHNDDSLTTLTFVTATLGVPVLNIEFKRINSTNTTATGIRALIGEHVGG